jgi:hypothetical protein
MRKNGLAASCVADENGKASHLNVKICQVGDDSWQLFAHPSGNAKPDFFSK